jgi:hypothetical protein
MFLVYFRTVEMWNITYNRVFMGGFVDVDLEGHLLILSGAARWFYKNIKS